MVASSEESLSSCFNIKLGFVQSCSRNKLLCVGMWMQERMEMAASMTLEIIMFMPSQATTLHSSFQNQSLNLKGH